MPHTAVEWKVWEDRTDKARHPNVIRTWTVERTKVPYRPPQPAKLPPRPRQDLFRGPEKTPRNPGSAPESGS
jgi:hypothetical protein